VLKLIAGLVVGVIVAGGYFAYLIWRGIRNMS
jgi:hypothetical protein